MCFSAGSSQMFLTGPWQEWMVSQMHWILLPQEGSAVLVVVAVLIILTVNNSSCPQRIHIALAWLLTWKWKHKESFIVLLSFTQICENTSSWGQTEQSVSDFSLPLLHSLCAMSASTWHNLNCNALKQLGNQSGHRSVLSSTNKHIVHWGVWVCLTTNLFIQHDADIISSSNNVFGSVKPAGRRPYSL